MGRLGRSLHFLHDQLSRSKKAERMACGEGSSERKKLANIVFKYSMVFISFRWRCFCRLCVNLCGHGVDGLLGVLVPSWCQVGT